jgi:hypothetical protein
MIAALAGERIIAAGCMQQRGSLLVLSGNQELLLLIAPLRHCSPLRCVSYTAPQWSVTVGGTTFISAMMDSHHSISCCVSFVAPGRSQIRSRPHGCTSRLTSGLTDKTKLNVINGFKGSLLAGFDDIPELIVKCCV